MISAKFRRPVPLVEWAAMIRRTDGRKLHSAGENGKAEIALIRY